MGKIGEFFKNDYNSLEMTEAQNWGIKTEREELIELDWQGWGGDGRTREHSWVTKNFEPGMQGDW